MASGIAGLARYERCGVGRAACLSSRDGWHVDSRDGKTDPVIPLGTLGPQYAA
jgi:hypothetical protein